MLCVRFWTLCLTSRGYPHEVEGDLLKAADELKLATGPYKAARDAYVAATATYTKSLDEEICRSWPDMVPARLTAGSTCHAHASHIPSLPHRSHLRWSYINYKTISKKIWVSAWCGSVWFDSTGPVRKFVSPTLRMPRLHVSFNNKRL